MKEAYKIIIFMIEIPFTILFLLCFHLFSINIVFMEDFTFMEFFNYKEITKKY